MYEEKENRPFIDFVCSLNECKKYLDQPITLPCKIHNICKIHLDSLALKSLNPNGIDHINYYCAPCGLEFRLDLADLNVNLNVSKSINLNQHLTGFQKQVKKSLEQLYSYIDDIQFISPENDLFEFFLRIKNQVIIHRNKQIDEITTKSAQIIDQISKFEADCKLNLDNLDTIDVDELKNKKFAEWNQQLRVPNIDTTKLSQLLNEINSSMHNVSTTISKFKSEMFMNKTVEFKPNENIDFGSLNWTENVLQPDHSFRTFQGHQDPIRCALIDSNNKKLISGGHDNKIKVWNLKNGKLEFSLNLHKNCVSSLLIAGNKLISGSWDSTIKVWDMKEGFKLINSIHNDDHVTCLELLSESLVLAGIINGKIVEWNVEKSMKLKSLKVHDSAVLCLKLIAPNLLISSSSDKSIKLINLETKRSLKTLLGHEDKIYCLDWRKSDNLLLSGSDDKTIKLWSLNTFECLRTISIKEKVYGLKLIDNDWLVVGCLGKEKNLLLFDLNSNCVFKEFIGHSSFVFGLFVYQNDANEPILVSYSGDKTIKFWKI
jgi:WD40 repeat protein